METLTTPHDEPVVGFEPTTDGLQNRCSTTELNRLTGTKIITLAKNKGKQID